MNANTIDLSNLSDAERAQVYDLLEQQNKRREAERQQMTTEQQRGKKVAALLEVARGVLSFALTNWIRADALDHPIQAYVAKPDDDTDEVDGDYAVAFVRFPHAELHLRFGCKLMQGRKRMQVTQPPDRWRVWFRAVVCVRKEESLTQLWTVASHSAYGDLNEWKDTLDGWVFSVRDHNAPLIELLESNKLHVLRYIETMLDRKGED